MLLCILQMVDVGMTKDSYHIIPATLTVNHLDLRRLRYGGVTVTGFQLNGLKQMSNVSLLFQVFLFSAHVVYMIK